MQAQLDLTVRQTSWPETVKERNGLRHYAKRMWSSITKCVKYDKDAIFKDPNWPRLWS